MTITKIGFRSPCWMNEINQVHQRARAVTWLGGKAFVGHFPFPTLAVHEIDMVSSKPSSLSPERVSSAFD